MDLREKLNNFAEGKGWGKSDTSIVELLREERSLEEFDRDEHRWYTLFSKIIKIEEMFIRFTDVTNSGDEPALEKEEINEIVLETMVEVFPKEVKTIKYFTKEESEDIT